MLFKFRLDHLKPFVSKPSPITNLVSPNPLLKNKNEPVYAPSYFTGGNWKDLPHITQKSLPLKPTDIRGVDTLTYYQISRMIFSKSVPTLNKNRFFMLKFFPFDHHFSFSRKSNVAYTFSNRQVGLLNDRVLMDRFSKYKGKYKRLGFFNTQPLPLGTSVARTKYRKLVKRELHKSLWDVVPNVPQELAKVSGVFAFLFLAVPTVESELQKVSLEVRRAVETLYGNEEFNRSIREMVQRQTFPRIPLGTFQLENHIDARKVPCYYPKLPYLKKIK